MEGNPDKVIYDFSRTHDFRRKVMLNFRQSHLVELMRHFGPAGCAVMCHSFWMCIFLFLGDVIWKIISQSTLNSSLIRYLRGFLLDLLKVIFLLPVQKCGGDSAVRKLFWEMSSTSHPQYKRKDLRQWADVSCQHKCSNAWCCRFLVACYHLFTGGYHPQRSADTVDPIHCTFTEAYESNHAPCLYVRRDNSANKNSV